MYLPELIFYTFLIFCEVVFRAKICPQDASLEKLSIKHAFRKHADKRKRIWGKEHENFDRIKQKQVESTNVTQNANTKENQIHSTYLAITVNLT